MSDCGGQRFESPQLHQEVGANRPGSPVPTIEYVPIKYPDVVGDASETGTLPLSTARAPCPRYRKLTATSFCGRWR